MSWIDWLVVVAFLIGVTVVGFWFAKRASGSAEDFFVGGRGVPWWLAGTSILATSFASDTPLHTTRMIREHGLGGAWFYWGGILSMVLVAFFFARMWRRTGVVTDNELLELRYAGKRAAWLRGGMALYKTLFLEILTMAWVTLGMTKVIKVLMDLPDEVLWAGMVLPADGLIVAVLVLLTVSFCMASGFWGVVTTDLVEFAIATFGAIVLSFIAIDRVGGVAALREGIARSDLGPTGLQMLPDFSGEAFTVLTIGVFLGVQWWAHASVDGSGHRAQRFLSSKDEGNALAAGLWSLVVQWLIRSWPWYIAALASIVLYPEVEDAEAVYPQMVADLLPVGLKGLMVASFISAFMSTMDSHYNLTASYAVNDVYRRFVAKTKSAAHYVTASRLATAAVALAAGVLALLLPSVLGAFRFKMELMSGLGLVYVLRWVWWRVNATTELVTLGVSVVAAVTLNTLPQTSGGDADGSALRLLAVVLVSGVAAVVTASMTAPEPLEHLSNFYRKVRPPGLWGPVAVQAGGALESGLGWHTFAQMGIAIVSVFSGMIGIGKLCLGEPWLGLGLTALSAALGYATVKWVFHVSAGAEPS